MLKNFFKNKSLVTLIAGVICLAIVVYFYHYRVNKIIDTITMSKEEGSKPKPKTEDKP